MLTNFPFTGVSGKASAPNWIAPGKDGAPCSTDRRALQAPRSSAALTPGDAHNAAAEPGAEAGAACPGLGAKLGGTVGTIDVLGSSRARLGLA